jgi:putative membrane protein
MRKQTIALSLSGLCAAALAVASPQAHPGTTQPGSPSGTHAGSPAGTQENQRSQEGATSQATSATKDAGFIKQAAADGQAEVELGQLASSKATRPEVKEFAQMMVSDHGKANDELKELASRKGVTLPTEPTAAQKAEKARLEKLSGAAFDDAYTKAMEKDHRKAVNLFSKQAKSGSDNEVKQWAEEKLPKLKEHLTKAEQLAGSGAGKGADREKGAGETNPKQ